MKLVEPKIFIIAETMADDKGRDAMLKHIGVPEEWDTDGREGQELVEIAGRLCYKSFGTELNANLTKVREGNMHYIGNIIKTEHGSVMEHASTTVAMIDVSRILTHEYVRHRQGTAFSQESMRFVRMDDIPIWIPDLSDVFGALKDYLEEEDHADIDNLNEDYAKAMRRACKVFEDAYQHFTPYIDKPGVPFSIKKKITSALRRMAPSGHATNIIGTGNHRAWRFQIQQRTAAGAETEIRLVFGMIAEDFKVRYPAFYQDMTSEMVDGAMEYKFEHHKI